MEVDPKELGRGLKRVLHACKGASEGMSVVWLDVAPREKFLRLVASDNYRLAVASVPFGDGGDAIQMAIHRDDVVAALHFLARASSPMKLLPWEQETRIAFQDPYAALILPNWVQRNPVPKWRELADQKWEHELFANLGFLGDAGVAAEGPGYLRLPEDPTKQPAAFVTHDYAEYIMPLRSDNKPKDHEEYGVFKL